MFREHSRGKYDPSLALVAHVGSESRAGRRKLKKEVQSIGERDSARCCVLPELVVPMFSLLHFGVFEVEVRLRRSRGDIEVLILAPIAAARQSALFAWKVPACDNSS